MSISESFVMSLKWPCIVLEKDISPILVSEGFGKQRSYFVAI